MSNTTIPMHGKQKLTGKRVEAAHSTSATWRIVFFSRTSGVMDRRKSPYLASRFQHLVRHRDLRDGEQQRTKPNAAQGNGL